jgi:ubiquinone/menaquinone biosynthesis C-methylase UbiE
MFMNGMGYAMQNHGSSQNHDLDGIGPGGAKAYSILSRLHPASRQLHRIVLEYIDGFQGNTILDVGCGTGNLIGMIARLHPNIQIFGIDPNENMIAVASAKRKRFREPERINFAVGNSGSVPFDGNFDLIISTISFHHWKDKQGGLAYLSGRLSTNGTLAIFEDFAASGRVKTRGRFSHAMSRETAETLSIPGFEKEVHVKGNSISIQFRRKVQ